MTRPTDEQIKALRKGDVVTVRAVVSKAPDDIDSRVSVSSPGVPYDFYIDYEDIASIEPREIKVGDRVREGKYEGEVKAICDGLAWVRYDRFNGEDREPNLCADKISDLQVRT